MNMDLVELRIFKAVAEQGGITRAAAALHRVQSNVTTRVQAARGAPRHAALPPRGPPAGAVGRGQGAARLCRAAAAALGGSAGRGARPRAAGRPEARRARKHRGYAAAAGARALTTACNPAVRLELVTGTTGALADKLLREELDAAFIAEPFTARGLETRACLHRGAGADHARKAIRASPARRTSHERTLLAFTTGCAYRRRLETWLGRSSVVAERVMEYGSYHAIVACAAAGGGIAGRAAVGAARERHGGAARAAPAAAEDRAGAAPCWSWRRGHHSNALDALRKELG